MTKSSPARLRAQKKYNRKPAQRKRRAALNKENRRRGTYGNRDGLDVSHKKSGRTTLEKASTNRKRNGRNGKSKFKK
jgi:hypothetical protein